VYAMNIAEPGATLMAHAIKRLAAKPVPMPDYEGLIAVVALKHRPPAKWREYLSSALAIAAKRGLTVPDGLDIAPG
jgi:hypothetical protein